MTLFRFHFSKILSAPKSIQRSLSWWNFEENPQESAFPTLRVNYQRVQILNTTAKQLNASFTCSEFVSP